MESIDSPRPQGGGAEAAALEATAAGRAPAIGKAGGSAAPSARYFLRSGKFPDPILETVIGEDERARILETADAPWRMICSLLVEFPQGAVMGTGWLAGPTTVMTAGHCVHDADRGGFATRITVTPGLNRNVKPNGQVIARRFSTTGGWIDSRDRDQDIGVIHLNVDATADGREGVALGTDLGTFGIEVRSDADLKGSFIQVAGYPGEGARGFGKEMWAHRSHVTFVTPRRIFYDVDTTAGQSGAPAFVVGADPAMPIAAGIHAYGTGGTPAGLGIEANSAPRITNEVFDMIERWIDKGAAD